MSAIVTMIIFELGMLLHVPRLQRRYVSYVTLHRLEESNINYEILALTAAYQVVSSEPHNPHNVRSFCFGGGCSTQPPPPICWWRTTHAAHQTTPTNNRRNERASNGRKNTRDEQSTLHSTASNYVDACSTDTVQRCHRLQCM